VKCKLVITGDSHARECALTVKNLISDKSGICGFVKLGSGVNILIKSAKKKRGHEFNKEGHSILDRC
jgi:hypothetical protein